MTKRDIHFCEKCGAPTERIIPEGDTHERDACTRCDYVAYVNPLPIVGTVPFFEDKVLLCRRAIEPRRGFWTLPAGHQECGETTREGALRETEEEAGLDVKLEQTPYIIFDLSHSDQIHILYRAKMRSERMNPGPETFEARLFSAAEIPWDKLAFHTVDKALRLYFEDRETGNFPLHFIERKTRGRIP